MGTGDQDAPLAVDGAQSVAGVSKSIHEKKGVEMQRGTGELEGKITNTETNILALCRVWLPLKCGLKLVKTCERRMQNKNK